MTRSMCQTLEKILLLTTSSAADIAVLLFTFRTTSYCISQNVFLKIYFSKYISQIYNIIFQQSNKVIQYSKNEKMQLAAAPHLREV